MRSAPARSPRGVAIMVVAVALVATAAYLSGLGLFLLVALTAIVALGLPASISFQLRLVVAFPVLFSLVIPTVGILQVLGVGIHPVAITVLIGTPFAFIALRQRQRSLGLRKAADWIPALVGVAVGTTLLAPTLGETPGQRIARMVGDDNVYHLSIARAVQENGGFIYFVGSRLHGTVLDAHITYPQGLHAWIAAVANFINSGTGRFTSEQWITSYLWAAYLIIASLVALASACTVLLLRARAASEIAMTIAALVVATALFLGPILGIFYVGGIVTLAAILPMVLVVVTAAIPDMRPAHALVIGGAACGAVAQTWYLLLPAAGLPYLVLLWHHRRDVTNAGWRCWTIVAVLAAASTVPLAVSLGVVSAANLNIPGAAFPIWRSALLTLCTLAAIAALMRAPKGQPGHAVYVVSGVTIGASALAIRQYQLTTAGVTSYYYEKFLDGVFILALIGAAVLLGTCLDALASRSVLGRASGAIAGVLVLLASSIALGWVGPDTTTSNFALEFLSGRVTSIDTKSLDFAFDYHARNRALDAAYIYWADQSQPVFDYSCSRWATEIAGRVDEPLHAFLAQEAHSQDLGQLRTFATSYKRPVVLLTRDPKMRTRLIRAGFANDVLAKIRVISLPN